MVEPMIATQDDFSIESEEGKLRMIVTPMRYHAVGIGSVVSSNAFDRLRDDYLKLRDNIYLDNCGLCGGDVTTQQQFVRTERSFAEFPVLTHLVCEERRQAEQKVIGESFLIGKINYQAKEIENLKGAIYAISKGKEQSSSVKEYSDGDRSGQATEASRRNSIFKSGQVASQEQSIVQESKGPITDGPYKFRIDDVMFDGNPLAKQIYETKYKWPPEFKRYEGPAISTSTPNCKNDPLGCAIDDKGPAERYGYTFKNPPSHDISPNTDKIGSCCE